MQWYYLDAKRQQNQTDESGLKDLLGDGAISEDTLVWNESMTEWLPVTKALPGLTAPGESGDDKKAAPEETAGVNPYSSPATASSVPLANSAATGPSTNVRAFAAILAQNAGWIKFVGILTIIGGVLNCLTIVGAIIGWAYIWLGILAMRTARLAGEAEASGSAQGFSDALESVSKFFKVTGILALIVLIVSVIALGVSFVLGAGGAFETMELPE